MTGTAFYTGAAATKAPLICDGTIYMGRSRDFEKMRAQLRVQLKGGLLHRQGSWAPIREDLVWRDDIDREIDFPRYVVPSIKALSVWLYSAALNQRMIVRFVFEEVRNADYLKMKRRLETCIRERLCDLQFVENFIDSIDSPYWFDAIEQSVDSDGTSLLIFGFAFWDDGEDDTE